MVSRLSETAADSRHPSACSLCFCSSAIAILVSEIATTGTLSGQTPLIVSYQAAQLLRQLTKPGYVRHWALCWLVQEGHQFFINNHLANDGVHSGQIQPNQCLHAKVIIDTAVGEAGLQ